MRRITNEEIIQILQHVPLFKKLNKEELEKVSKVINYKTYKKGVRIINEGDEGDEIYILKSGAVLVLKKTLAQEEYTVIKIERKEGFVPFFGEIALLDNDKRSASVVADTDVELLVINRDDFIKLGDKYPKLGILMTREISKILAQRLRKANEDMLTLFKALVEEAGGEIV